MKRLLVVVICIATVCAIYIYLEEVFYSPLKEKEFKTLFRQYEGRSKKECSVDLLGLSIHGEYFEFYRYKMGNILIDTTYPKSITEWEYKRLTDDDVFLKWTSCPVDTATMKRYEITLAANNLDERACFRSFNKELSNPQNYYAYVYFNELEDYFFLYCSENQHLYYVRRKGF